MRSLNGRTLPVNTIGFSSCHQIADWVYAVYGCVAEKMVACFRGMPILDGPGGADADICWLSAVLPMPQKYPQWRPYSKRTMSSVRTPFVHSPVPTNSWEFRKSSPCRPFDVLPNVNATNSWTFFFTKFRQYARIMLHLGLRFNGPICLHIRKLEMQFQMYTQEFPNNDSVGFQSLGRGVVSGRMQPWNLGSLQPWNPVTLEVWILARQT